MTETAGQTTGTENRPVRIAVVGLGKRTVTIMDHLAKDGLVELVAVAENAPRTFGEQPWEDFVRGFGAQPYSDGSEMIAKENLDAICLCVSPKWRLPLVEAAARKGLHISMEKPMATTLEQADRILAITRQAGVQLMMEFPMRFLPPVVELKRLLDRGALGKPFLLNGDYVMLGPIPPTHWMWDPHNGNSPLNENTCHLFDTACHIMGTPVELMAYGGNYLGNGAPLPDCAAITVKFADGGIAALTGGAVSSRVQQTPMWLNVHATGGQAVLTGGKHTYTRLEWSPRSARVGDESAISSHDWGYPYDLIEPNLRAFATAVRDGRPVPCTGEDGRKTLALTLATLESIQTGRPAAVPA